MRKTKLLVFIFAVLVFAGGFLLFKSKNNTPAILGTSSDKETEGFFGGSDIKSKAGEKAEFSISKKTGKVTYLSGGEGGSIPLKLQKAAKKEPVSVAGEFMKEYGEYFGLDNPSKELEVLGKKKDEMGMNHVVYNQAHKGVPIFGAQAIVHLKKNLSVSSANANILPDISVDTDPELSQKEAENEAGKLWKKQFDGADYKVKKTTLFIFNKGLLEHKKESDSRLVWEVELENAEKRKHEFYLIDARNGDLVFQVTGIKEAISRRVYDCSLGTYLLDYLYLGYYYGRSEGQVVRGVNPVYGGADVDNLFDITNSMHNYLSSKFSRNGANNQGGLGDGNYSPATRTDSFAYIDPMYWTDCPNAFFSGYDINFCNGMVVTDVVGHEYGHGIVYNSVPGDLTYYGESGALNEAYADLFGEALEYYRDGSSDWLSGGDVNVGGFAGPIRNMQNPGSLSDPDRFYSSNFYCGSDDNAGVHTNSTVMSHGAYLLAMGGSFNGCSVSGIGRDKQERIFYRALTTYFTSSTDFNAAYDAVRQACGDLYGSGSNECAQVKTALQSVEMDQGGACSGETRIQPCVSSAPVVSGVSEGATYSSDVTITFDKGTATLNGASVSSGAVVTEDGSYVLVVTDSVNGVSTTVNFIISKVTTDTPTLPYNTSKKAKKTIRVTFIGKAMSTKKKYVSARLGGRKVKVKRISNSGGNFSVWLNFKYRKWPVGSYSLGVSYKKKVGKSWQRGSLSKNSVLSII